MRKVIQTVLTPVVAVIFVLMLITRIISGMYNITITNGVTRIKNKDIDDLIESFGHKFPRLTRIVGA